MKTFRITIYQDNNAPFHYSGIFSHSFDAVVDALNRFGFAVRIHVGVA